MACKALITDSRPLFFSSTGEACSVAWHCTTGGRVASSILPDPSDDSINPRPSAVGLCFQVPYRVNLMFGADKPLKHARCVLRGKGKISKPFLSYGGHFVG